MPEFANTKNVATFAELASTPGDTPFAFCVENSFLYFWNPTAEEWVEFLNGVAVTQEIANAIAEVEGAVASVNGQTGTVVLDKSHVGLGSADNTSDSGKPVSTDQAAADAAVQAAAVQRANHTGTQSADSITDGSTNKAYTGTEKTKLSGVATGATANDTDANLKNRANHTGTQLASTISDFAATALAARTDPTAFGYATGAGGTITQATNKSTAVTLNELCGQITMHNAALAAGAIVSFTLNNSTILANDLLVLNHVATATFGPYLLNARAAAGSAIIDVRNTSAGSLSNAIQIRFAVIRGVVA